FFFFFFSSRRRHTRSDRDWSSDVCSSDLAGRRPFTGDSYVQILHAIINDCPPPLSKLRPETPYDFRVIVEKATEKDPSDRYQSRSEERRVGKECRTRWSAEQ